MYVPSVNEKVHLDSHSSKKRLETQPREKSRKTRIEDYIKTSSPMYYTPKHQCSYEGCGYYTESKRDFENHIRAHTGEKPYKCLHRGCSFAASRKNDFSAHLFVCSFRADLLAAASAKEVTECKVKENQDTTTTIKERSHFNCIMM